jgi:hexosaminidase
LQAYFNQRVAQIVTKHGKKMIGWDEVVHPALPKNIVVQSWRGADSLAAAAKQGYTGILSNGYYIDLMFPARDHYLNDPIPENTTLTPAEQKLILGGEATMWSEWTSPETIDSHIWPRTAAIAERFWSPREVRDVDEMYRRLPYISRHLEDAGLLHWKNHPAMVRRYLGSAFSSADYEAFDEFLRFLEPVKRYQRGTMQPATQFTPLTRLPDLARADAPWRNEAARLVEQALYGGTQEDFQRLQAALSHWLPPVERLRALAEQSLALRKEAKPLAENLATLQQLAVEAVAFLTTNNAPAADWRPQALARWEAAAKPNFAVELVVAQPVKELILAAAEKEKRQTMSTEEWKQYVKALAAPKRRQ